MMEPDQSARLPLETGRDTLVAPRSFFGAPWCDDLSKLDADVAFIGVPHDQGANNSGARYAPNELRDTRCFSYSAGRDENGKPGGYFDIDADRHLLAGVTMADCGNITNLVGDVERNFSRITRVIRQIAASRSLFVAFGGDHSITTPIVRGLDQIGRPIDIVHFDAHHDYRDHIQGIRTGNSTPLRRCAEYPWVRNISHFGIHDCGYPREPIDAMRARGNVLVSADKFRAIGPEAAMALVPESDAIYLTFDIDAMDPSCCPGTGSPVPGGLTYLEARAALRALAKRGRVIGMDLVEVAPHFDVNGITSRTALNLVIDFLTAVFEA